MKRRETLHRRRCSWAIAGILLASSATAADAPLQAEMMPKAAVRSLMLDVADAGSRGVIVGERGHILISESRTDWRQVDNIPTRATLTAVTAVGDHVWAVGHDGVILNSADGGLTWALQREDRKVEAGEDDTGEYDPRKGAPLLDVMFEDAQNGYAVGAFSLMLRTRDGGQNWEPVDVSTSAQGDSATTADEVAPQPDDAWTFSDEDLALDEEENPHLNSIVRGSGGMLMVVGERGSAFRSRDDGASWERLQLPYGGSMFGVLALGEQHFVAFGLRGHVLETVDGGTVWNELDTSTELSLMGGAALPEGGFVIVGANGVVLRRGADQSAVSLGTYTNQESETPVLASVLPLGSRTFLVCGDNGLGRYEANN